MGFLARKRADSGVGILECGGGGGGRWVGEKRALVVWEGLRAEVGGEAWRVEAD